MAPLPSFLNATVSPIGADDVLRHLVAAADPDTLPAGSYDIANRDDLTCSKLIKLFAWLKGLKR